MGGGRQKEPQSDNVYLKKHNDGFVVQRGKLFIYLFIYYPSFLQVKVSLTFKSHFQERPGHHGSKGYRKYNT